MDDKKNLVITRAGDDSLHEGWLKGHRNWDMIVSCFGSHPEKWQRDDVIHIVYQGGKGDGLYDAFQQIPGLLDKYDYIMMADDDFAMTANDINRTFDIMRAYDLQIGQPSFSCQSHCACFPIYHNPRFKLRYANYTESSTVCLSAHVWRQILPLYQNNPMGWWIDVFWGRLTDDPKRQMAIIDDIQITHTRPYQSGEIYDKKKKHGWSEKGPVQFSVPGDQRDVDQWNLPKLVCHAGILKNKKTVRGRWMMLPFLLSGWREAAKNIHPSKIHANRSARRCIKRAIINQITGKSLLTKTHIIIHDPS